MRYVDRTLETQEFVNIFNEMKESSVIFLYSKTGVGKSSLSQKFINQILQRENITAVKVLTNRINKTEASFDGQYLIEIFKSLNNLFKETKKLSFATFVKKSKNKAHKKYILEKILSDAEKSSTLKNLFLKIPTFWLLKRVFKLNEFNCENFTNDYSIQSLQLINSYIEYILENHRLIMVIDNIQNIDKKSIQYITNWLMRYKEMNHLFLFEYTIENADYRDYFKNYDIEVKLREIKNLDEKYAIEAAISNAQESISGTISTPDKTKEYYKQIDGNIRYLEDFIRQYNINPEHNLSYTPTHDNIISLDTNSLFVFCLICLNQTQINRFELENIVQDKNIELSKILKQLSDINNLIHINQNDISIKHASIYDCWKNSDSNLIKLSNLVAYQSLESHYQKLLNNNEKTNIHKAFITLLKLYIEFEPNKIYDLLNEFEILAIEFVSPERLSEYIYAIDTELANNANEFIEFYFKLIDICLETGLYELSSVLLERIEKKAPLYKYLFYKCNHMVKSENHSNNIKFIKEIISGVESELLVLFLKLFLIISYRSTNNYDMVKETEHEIENYLKDNHHLCVRLYYQNLL